MIRVNSRRTNTVTQDWFGEDVPEIDHEHLIAFPSGHYFRALVSYAMQQIAEEILDAG